jgi:predicted AAA+ superfamily ATPase
VPLRLSSYRTEHGAEVDFIVESGRETLAVEVKASTAVIRVDTRGFRSFADYYGRRHRPVLVYLGAVRKVVNGIDVLPWQLLLKTLRL